MRARRGAWLARALGAGVVAAACALAALGGDATAAASRVAEGAGDAGSAADAEAAQQAPACGKPGLPPCPMQAFMRARVSASLASRDDAALAAALERTGTLVPDPAWASWVTAATAGAEAARKGDVAGARASCKACHDAWREAYREKHRARPITP